MKSIAQIKIPIMKDQIKYFLVSLPLWTIGLILFYDHPFAALFGSIAAALLTYPSYAGMQKKRDIRLQQLQFLDFLQSLSASIESGRSMEEGMEESLRRLLDQKAKKTEFLRMMEKTIADRKKSREADIHLLEKMADASVLDDLKDFVRSYGICRRTGGDLEQAIGLTCQVISEKMKLHQELQVLSAQKRMESRLISLMPLMILLFLRMTSPDYIAPLYDTGAGRMIMTLSIVTIGAGYYWTDRIMEVRG